MGWATAGEWMKYTFTAEYGGIYDLSLECASTSYSGQLRLFLDGVVLTTINSTPITGSWTTYEELIIEDLDIPIGEHELMLQILQSGPNLRSMIFTLDSAYAFPEIPNTFTLDQNYPNPFNSGTTIPVSTQTEGPLEVEILDILGRQVKTFEVDQHSTPNIKWDGINVDGQYVPAGVYLYRASVADEQLVRKMIYLP